jgi:hypothetical protein
VKLANIKMEEFFNWSGKGIALPMYLLVVTNNEGIIFLIELNVLVQYALSNPTFLPIETIKQRIVIRGYLLLTLRAIALESLIHLKKPLGQLKIDHPQLYQLPA